MRRTFLQNEEAPARLTPIPQETAEAAVESLPTQKAPAKKRESGPRKHTESGSPLKARLLKGGIITFATLGAASLILPILAGAPLGTLIESVSLKRAYSGTNLNYLRGNAALKTGNLAAATEALLRLPYGSPEFGEIGGTLFLKLLEAKDYERAAQILNHMSPGRKPAAVSIPLDFYTNLGNSTAANSLSPAELATSMAVDLGLEKSLAKLEQTPGLRAIRAELLPALFHTAALKEISALESLVPTLQGEERNLILVSIIRAHLQAKNWDSVWRHNEMFPPQLKTAATLHILREMAVKSPQEAIASVIGEKNSSEFLERFAVIYPILIDNTPQHARQLFEQLDSPVQRQFAIGLQLTAYRSTKEQLSVEQTTALLDQLTDVDIKAWALPSVNMPRSLTTPAARQEFVLKQLVARFTALAHQHPELIPQHDAFIMANMGPGTTREVQAQFLVHILNPTTRATVKKEWESGKISVKYHSQPELLTNIIKTIINRTQPRN